MSADRVEIVGTQRQRERLVIGSHIDVRRTRGATLICPRPTTRTGPNSTVSSPVTAARAIGKRCNAGKTR